MCVLREGEKREREGGRERVKEREGMMHVQGWIQDMNKRGTKRAGNFCKLISIYS